MESRSLKNSNGVDPRIRATSNFKSKLKAAQSVLKPEGTAIGQSTPNPLGIATQRMESNLTSPDDSTRPANQPTVRSKTFSDSSRNDKAAKLNATAGDRVGSNAPSTRSGIRSNPSNHSTRSCVWDRRLASKANGEGLVGPRSIGIGSLSLKSYPET